MERTFQAILVQGTGLITATLLMTAKFSDSRLNVVTTALRWELATSTRHLSWRGHAFTEDVHQTLV
jgi:hypothetical protein